MATAPPSEWKIELCSRKFQLAFARKPTSGDSAIVKSNQLLVSLRVPSGDMTCERVSFRKAVTICPLAIARCGDLAALRYLPRRGAVKRNGDGRRSIRRELMTAKLAKHARGDAVLRKC